MPVSPNIVRLRDGTAESVSNGTIDKLFHTIKRPSGVPVSKGERSSQRDVSWDGGRAC